MLHTKKRVALAAAVVSAILGMASCGGGSDGPSTPPPVLTSINVALANPTLLPGQTTTATASGVDQNGASIATGTVVWSSGAGTVATINSAGSITAVAPGTTQIVASAGGRQGTATLTVNPPPVATVTITPTTASIIVGLTQQFSAATLDAAGAALTGRTITWSSSDPTRVSVSTNGLATAVAVGSATITATSEGRTATATMNVLPVPVASVTLSPSSASIAVAATQQFTATTLDAAGNALPGRTVVWTTSDPSRATVSATGVATGVSPGAASITATSEGRSASAAITITAPACDQLRAVNVGQSVNGSLTTSDCRLQDGSYTHKYDLRLAAQTAVTIEMTSTTVDAYLYLLDASNGSVVDEDDDRAGGRNARIERLLPAGRYVIYANTFAANETGAYQLTVQQAPTACFTAAPLAVPTALNATLRTSACRLRDGTYADRYELVVPTRANYQFTMTSGVFDAYLGVFSSTGQLQGEDDDGAGGTNARLTLTLEPGRYTILSTSFDAGSVGAYSLDVRLYTNPCSVVRALVFGVPTSSIMSSSDCVLDGGRLTQRWSITLAQSTQLLLNMSSTQFDAYLELYDVATGALVAEDDDGGGGTNARLIGTLPAGQYIVNATTFGPGEIGSFTISLGQPVATSITVAVNPTVLTLQPGITQNVTATLTNTVNSLVTWRSTAPTVATVTSTGQVRGVAPGTADVIATSAADPLRSATVRVTVTTSSTSTPNLDISNAYVTQAIQTLDGRLPLVANRRALLRVFVRSSQFSVPAVQVRLRLFNNGNLINTLTTTTTPTVSFDESCCAAEFAIPEAQVTPGLEFLADVDPAGAVTEINETDNSYPLSGTAQRLTVQTVPDFRVVMVPVRFNKNGRLGQATNALLEHTRVVWPLSNVQSSIAATFSTDLAPLVGDDRNGSWSDLLRQMDAKRQIEGSTAYYFGVLNVDYNSGLTGLAYLGGKAGIGIDGSFGAGTRYSTENMAHELGHNFGRPHTPCFTGNNRPANVDPNYPFADGRIGVFGVDLLRPTLARYTPTSPDIMGYCDSGFASVYSWSAVSVYRASGANRIVLPPRAAVVVSGMIRDGALSVEPAFSAVTSPAVDDAAGTHMVEARDAGGKLLATRRFTPLEADHEQGVNTRAFVVALPLDAAQQEALVTLSVRALSGAVPAAQRARVASKSAIGAEPFASISARSVSATDVELSWERESVPAIAVRDRRTGEVLSFGTTGTLRMRESQLATVEFLVSNGVRSRVQPSSAVVRRAP